jgi:hypothetical protein
MSGDLDAPTNTFADADTPRELLGMLAGAASVCWTDINQAGVFQSEQASAFVDAAMDRLIEMGWATDER